MKTTHRIIACLIALICFSAQRAAADSPLTSTNFHQAYADEPIVAQVEKGRTPSDEVWAYLAAPDNPVAVKMAIINKIGWAFEGKNSYQLFLSYLKRQGICKREKDLYQKRRATCCSRPLTSRRWTTIQRRRGSPHGASGTANAPG